ncbi:MAG: hypothetical protein HYR64_07320 [Fimbriimonas ginsengisoli]|uniref:RHS repeat-associated core domain-containing protein n=1 Tax=Fimbriimonas ginsengisoli TaxID=1005039 RepID=A0A931PU05_FIMGI|nr:hypothetical protein [Fimbriimonas ginsengisoli]
MKRAFYTIDGTIIAESSGGVRTDYMHDALGSVIGAVDATGVVTNTYRWKPYGSLLSSTGPNPTPTFGWLGGLGYRASGRSHSDYYVRARHYSAVDAAWLAADPEWPAKAAYIYANDGPTSTVDPTGRGQGQDPFRQWSHDMDLAVQDLANRLIAAFTRSDRLAIRINISIRPVYGNYCGPQSGDYGWHWYDASRPWAKDAMDAACRKHDDCWEKIGCNAANQLWRIDCAACTQVLCDDLKQVDCVSDQNCNFWKPIFMDYACNYERAARLLEDLRDVLSKFPPIDPI